ncbi:DivIVA domain-containing protein [Clostridiaceae bacterium UIB06]|uniref:DivIVA domain-containing protein n=1 Tax=Clostridium thailandense TaxID=2794346 RepID=A0A949TR46_9CLOT|nr:DivIVA domain-containing protein [Clostridium thailandense]MBV7275027.1 DivIVA domain-containing protein [Clostridium thailandense]MCH5136541.1 DivIVA domain-containing protein [Clostridiaceae bacterium UIB06]
MKITAMEITNKEFKRSMRGYNADEVDEFLDKIAEDYENIYRENSTLKEKLSNIEDKIDHYNKMESTIQNTLLLAQNAAEQARENAKKESELVIRNANDTAQRIIDKAHNDVIQINDEFDRIKQEFCKFRTKFRSFMESQLEMFDDMEKEFIKNYNIGYESEENIKPALESKEIEIVHNENDDKLIEENDTFANSNELEEIKNFFVKD